MPTNMPMGNMGRRPKANEDCYKQGGNQINILEHRTLKPSQPEHHYLQQEFYTQTFCRRSFLPDQSFAMILKATTPEQQTYSCSDDQATKLERVTRVNPKLWEQYLVTGATLL